MVGSRPLPCRRRNWAISPATACASAEFGVPANAPRRACRTAISEASDCWTIEAR